MTTATITNGWLYEYAAGGSKHIDRAHNVIRDVKIHGLKSQNGRDYLPQALKRAIPLYEGAKVNTNHPDRKDLSAWRSYGDRIGVIRNVRFVEGSGLHGDFHYNPKHALIEQVLYDAEHAPHNLGFSPVVKGRTSTRNGRVVVEEIGSVRSVDLVADPATTRGLFEAVHTPDRSNSYLTDYELAPLLGMSAERLRDMADAGKIPGGKLVHGDATLYVFSYNAVLEALRKLTGDDAVDVPSNSESVDFDDEAFAEAIKTGRVDELLQTGSVDRVDSQEFRRILAGEQPSEMDSKAFAEALRK